MPNRSARMLKRAITSHRTISSSITRSRAKHPEAGEGGRSEHKRHADPSKIEKKKWKYRIGNRPKGRQSHGYRETAGTLYIYFRVGYPFPASCRAFNPRGFEPAWQMFGRHSALPTHRLPHSIAPPAIRRGLNGKKPASTRIIWC